MNNFWQQFGFNLGKSNKKADKISSSPIAPTNDDAAFVLGSDYYGHNIFKYNPDQSFDNENDLIIKYRDVALYPEVDKAISEIVNQAVTGTEMNDMVSIDLDSIEMSDNIKNKIREEFSNILNLLNFNIDGAESFRKWYVDGRSYYHVIIDENNKSKGIQELRYVSPLNIKKIREEKRETKNGIEQVTGVDEYFVYTDSYYHSRFQGVKISPDSIIFNSSGLIDEKRNFIYSYLHKAMKPANQLRMIEDATIIYRLSRAPERRVFYVDVGNLPKSKAEQYLKNIINKFKNKMVYDSTSGEIKDQNNTLSMMEDIWLPRRNGGKGTEVSTLPGGQNLGEINDILYFKKKLYQSLNVPMGRIDSEQPAGFSLGRSSEISREEVNFGKFIARLRKRYSNTFLRALRLQLILKNIVSEKEWDVIKNELGFVWNEDSYFNELKESEIQKDRLDLANTMIPLIGKFYSNEYIRKNILKLSEEDIDEMKKQIEQEKKAGEIVEPDPDDPETGNKPF